MGSPSAHFPAATRLCGPEREGIGLDRNRPQLAPESREKTSLLGLLLGPCNGLGAQNNHVRGLRSPGVHGVPPALHLGRPKWYDCGLDRPEPKTDPKTPKAVPDGCEIGASGGSDVPIHGQNPLALVRTAFSLRFVYFFIHKWCLLAQFRPSLVRFAYRGRNQKLAVSRAGHVEAIHFW